MRSRTTCEESKRAEHVSSRAAAMDAEIAVFGDQGRRKKGLGPVGFGG